jgi:hypothetical protein
VICFCGGITFVLFGFRKNNPVKSRGKKVARHLDKSIQFGTCISFIYLLHHVKECIRGNKYYEMLTRLDLWDLICKTK